MRESAIERAVVRYCQARGLPCYKFASPARRGVPDRLILYRGRAMFLELKAPTKKPTALQQRELQRLAEAGCHTRWADSIGLAIEHIEGFVSLVDTQP